MAAHDGKHHDQVTPAGQERRPRTRRLRSASTDPTVRNPALIVTVNNALPGENAPLSYSPDRTQPITEEEALGVIRRRKRAELTKRGVPAKEIDNMLPTSIAGWNDAKEAVTLRIQPRLLALATAHAEAEGTNFAALLDELMTAHVLTPPRDPQEVAQHRARLEAMTVRLDRFEQRLNTKADSYEDLREELAKLRAAVLPDS